MNLLTVNYSLENTQTKMDSRSLSDSLWVKEILTSHGFCFILRETLALLKPIKAFDLHPEVDSKNGLSFTVISN